MQYIFGITEKGEPKTSLSWSGFSLWCSNPSEYRERYYNGKPSRVSPETIYGNYIDTILDNPEKYKEEIANNPVLLTVPRYSNNQYGIEIELKSGLKINGRFDGFNPDTCSLLERKTGHADPKGNAPWSKVKVAKHRQLDWYSLLIQKKHKKVDRHVKLVWLETKKKEVKQLFNGVDCGFTKEEVYLTGRIEVYNRIIYKWELKKMEQDIIKVAQEIHEDYQKYKNNERTL